MRFFSVCALFSLILAGCGDPEGTGLYEIDKDYYASHMAQRMIELGEIDTSERLEIEKRLRATKYTLELKPDMTYVGVIQRDNLRMTYEGTWDLKGLTISLRRAADARSKASEMIGTLIDGQMRLRSWDAESQRNFHLRFYEVTDAGTPARPQ